jgi:hypothetical protein
MCYEYPLLDYMGLLVTIACAAVGILLAMRKAKVLLHDKRKHHSPPGVRSIE